MGIPKKWRCNPESHTENFGLVRDDIPKFSGILVWDFFGLGSGFFRFGLGFLGFFSSPRKLY